MTRTDKARHHAARRAARAAQTITIDSDWRIVRADELNWEVQYQGRFQGYYSDPIAAFHSLPAKMLNPIAAGTLDQILELCHSIQTRIETALKFKLA